MADPRFGGSERDYMGGVGSLGFDRMGGPRATPPANIGIDRAGSIRGNYNEGYRPGDVTELPLTEPRTYGRNFTHKLQHLSDQKNSRLPASGFTPYWGARGMMPQLTRTNFDDIMRGWETTTPEGYMSPDRYGRSRPTLPNPYEGAKIGGAWDQAAIDPSDWRVLQQIIKAGGNPDDYVQTAELSGPIRRPRVKPITIEMPDLPVDQAMDEFGNPTFGTWDDYMRDYDDKDWYGSYGGLASLRR